MDRATAQLPQTPAQRAHFLLFLLFLATLFITVMAFEQHLVDAQFISGDELKRNVQELQSFSAEAGLLSQYTVSKSAPRPYTEAYADSLQRATDSISRKLVAHPHSQSLDNDVQTCLQLTGQLSDQLQQLAREPADQVHGSPAKFKDLSDSFSSLEQQL